MLFNIANLFTPKKPVIAQPKNELVPSTPIGQALLALEKGNLEKVFEILNSLLREHGAYTLNEETKRVLNIKLPPQPKDLPSHELKYYNLKLQLSEEERSKYDTLIAKIKAFIETEASNASPYEHVKILKLCQENGFFSPKDYQKILLKLLTDSNKNIESLAQKPQYESIQTELSCLEKLKEIEPAFSESYNKLKLILENYLPRYLEQQRHEFDRIKQIWKNEKILDQSDAEALAQSYNMLSSLKQDGVLSSQALNGILEEHEVFIQALLSKIKNINLANDTSKKIYAIFIAMSNVKILSACKHQGIEEEVISDLDENFKAVSNEINQWGASTTCFNEVYIKIFAFLYLATHPSNKRFLWQKTVFEDQYLSFENRLAISLNDVQQELNKPFSDLIKGKKNPEAISTLVLTLSEVIQCLTLLQDITKHTQYSFEQQESVHKVVRSYIDPNGEIQQYILDAKSIETLNPQQMLGYFKSICDLILRVEKLIPLDSTLISTEQNFKDLHSTLVGWARAIESEQAKTLQSLAHMSQYWCLPDLYKRVNTSKFIEISDSFLFSILTQALKYLSNHVQKYLHEGKSLEKQNTMLMSNKTLARYFECIAWLQNYNVLLKFLENIRDTALESVFPMDLRKELTSELKLRHKREIDKLLANYEKKVTQLIEGINEEAEANFENFYQYLLPICNALNHFPPRTSPKEKNAFEKLIPFEENAALEDSRTVTHKRLIECINSHSKLFFVSLTHACNVHANTAVTDFSEKLLHFFEWHSELSQSHPVYAHAYQNLITNIQNEFLSFIKGKPENYGWDVAERLRILNEKKQYIPNVIWNPIERIIEKTQQEANKQMAEEEARISTLSIKELTERLTRLSHFDYGQLVKNQLEFLVQDFIEKRRQQSLEESVIDLDNSWADLGYCLEENPSINEHWKCDLTALTSFVQQISNSIILLVETMDSSRINQIEKLSSDESLFIRIILFLYTSNQLNNNSGFYTHFQENFNINKFFEYLQSILNFYNQLIDTFNSALKKNDFTTVEETQEIFRDIFDEIKPVLNFIQSFDSSKTSSLLPEEIIKNYKLHYPVTPLDNQITQWKKNAEIILKHYLSPQSNSSDFNYAKIFSAHAGLKNYCDFYKNSEDPDLPKLNDLLEKSREKILIDLKNAQENGLSSLPESSNSAPFKSDSYQNFQAHYEITSAATAAFPEDIYSSKETEICQIAHESEADLRSRIENLFSSIRFSEALIALDSEWSELNLNQNSFIALVLYCSRKEFEDTLGKHDSFQDPENAFQFVRESLYAIEAFISLYISQNENASNGLCAAIFPDGTIKKYLCLLENIINLYNKLQKSSEQHLTDNNFKEIQKIKDILSKYATELNIFIDLIKRSKLCEVKTPLNLNQKIEERLSLLSQNALLHISADSKVWSKDSEVREKTLFAVFTALEGLGRFCEQYPDNKAALSSLDQANEVVQIKISRIANKATAIFAKILTNNSYTDQFSSQHGSFYIAYDILLKAEMACKNEHHLALIQKKIATIESTVLAKMKEYVDNILDNKNISLEQIMSYLFELEDMRMNVLPFSDNAQNAIRELLHKITAENHFEFSFSDLSKAMKKYEGPYSALAQSLINNHLEFREEAIAIRNQKTLSTTIEDICAQLAKNHENTDFNHNLMMAHFKAFEEEYWTHIQDGLNVKDIKGLKTNAKLIKKILKKKKSDFSTKVIKLAACIFAHWSLSDYHNKKHDEVTFNEHLKNILLRPHPAQIVCIFRLLGLDNSNNTREINQNIQDNALASIHNHLALVETGAGKSVVLAALSTILASMGFDVDCVCYSPYLSDRDHESFKKLFEHFEVNNKISYGTFDSICNNIVNKQCDVREQVGKLAHGQDLDKIEPKSATPSKSILLIDEVDMFFDKSFCNSLYHLCYEFKSENVFKLMKFIWGNSQFPRREFLNLIKSHSGSSGYGALTKEITPELHSILDEAIQAMIEDVGVYNDEEANYVFANGKIGYRIQNSHDIQYGVVRRYQTIYALFKFSHDGAITEEKLKEETALLISCGKFAYAKIPQFYNRTLGVTGSLEALYSEKQTLVSQVMGETKKTHTPSVFGTKNSHALKDSSVLLADEDQHFSEIFKEIIKPQETQSTLRPIMVFFESKEQLDEYSKYLHSQSHFKSEDIITLHEGISGAEKSKNIWNATLPGKILLATRAYGRGVDFKCDDKNVNDAGGPHVIKTFFPEEISEETQFNGRTARAGNPGTYSYVLSFQDVKRDFDLDKETLMALDADEYRYITLNTAREKKAADQQAKSLEELKNAKKEHEGSMTFIKHLDKLTTTDPSNSAAAPAQNSEQESKTVVMQYLNETNKFQSSLAPKPKEFLTFILIDATSSMDTVLDYTKAKLLELLARVDQIVTAQQADLPVKSKSKICAFAYRNYNSKPEDLLMTSGIVNDSPEERRRLKNWFDTIKAKDGHGNEAIEVAMNAVNKVLETEKDKIDGAQIILIGDSIANTERDFTSWEQGWFEGEAAHEKTGEKYPSARYPKTRHPANTLLPPFPTHLAKILEHNKNPDKRFHIPVNTCCVDNGLDGSYNSVSFFYDVKSKTKGELIGLSTTSSNTLEMEKMGHFIAETILKSIGGEEYVEAYKKVFIPMMHTGSSIKAQAPSSQAPNAALFSDQRGSSSAQKNPAPAPRSNSLMNF